jgi:hypothetical protein
MIGRPLGTAALTLAMLAPVVCLGMCLGTSLGGCSKRTPEPGDTAPSAKASASAAPSSSAASVAALASMMAHLPHATPPPEVPDSGPPKPQREPDWDLDPDDPWHDYVTRYVRATSRYGDAADCVVIGKGDGAGGKRNVTVRNDPKGSCGPLTPKDDSVRDVFVVDVAADRLSVDDPDKRARLARWPDGSDPGGPAKKDIRGVDDLHQWKASMHDELRDMKLTAIRGQVYGRGTYLVLTLAGWRDPILPTMTPDQLRPTAERLCKSNGGSPLGVFAGLDRSNMLRVTCGPDGAKTRWDKL